MVTEGLRVVVSAAQSALGQGESIPASGPAISHGIALCGSDATRGLELEHDGGLDTISNLTQTLSLGQQTQDLFPRVSDADQKLTVLGAP